MSEDSKAFSEANHVTPPTSKPTSLRHRLSPGEILMDFFYFLMMGTGIFVARFHELWEAPGTEQILWFGSFITLSGYVMHVWFSWQTPEPPNAATDDGGKPDHPAPKAIPRLVDIGNLAALLGLLLGLRGISPAFACIAFVSGWVSRNRMTPGEKKQSFWRDGTRARIWTNIIVGGYLLLWLMLSLIYRYFQLPSPPL